ncbi:universal stress protein [Legionella jordanis]|uniref:Universal stress protein n=1 Tax=Legionella jordanis TaxID=456 RepID=A0A0W0VAT9_9GAMM|nr:universal stress protein [Legionella jordanis]KTD17183.1 universal stress protein A UspA [Legionella jordanis]RMX03304.1 universal stress protein [Legionella jordanis]RMX18282.1 universal stress protein [Legionella jordanis]VEH12619.1 universal stress protein A [Legionella jordanis]HAT8713307.1 universal stress protein [Legionella jordanis]
MYTTILHATDLSENHFNQCKKAVEIAKHFNAKLHLLHVIEPPASLQLAQGLGFAELANPVKDDAQTVMTLLGEALNIPAEQQHVEIGSLKAHILDKVKSLGCQLIILGSHNPSAVPAFLGSTAYAMLHHAPCDVLTLRADALA